MILYKYNKLTLYMSSQLRHAQLGYILHIKDHSSVLNIIYTIYGCMKNMSHSKLSLSMASGSADNWNIKFCHIEVIFISRFIVCMILTLQFPRYQWLHALIHIKWSITWKLEFSPKLWWLCKGLWIIFCKDAWFSMGLIYEKPNDIISAK